MQTVTHERDGARQALAAAKLRGAKLIDGSSPREQKVLEELSPSLLYAAARPSAEPEAVEALKGGDITTHKQYRAVSYTHLFQARKNFKRRCKIHKSSHIKKLAYNKYPPDPPAKPGVFHMWA